MLGLRALDGYVCFKEEKQQELRFLAVTWLLIRNCTILKVGWLSRKALFLLLYICPSYLIERETLILST